MNIGFMFFSQSLLSMVCILDVQVMDVKDRSDAILYGKVNAMHWYTLTHAYARNIVLEWVQ